MLVQNAKNMFVHYLTPVTQRQGSCLGQGRLLLFTITTWPSTKLHLPPQISTHYILGTTTTVHCRDQQPVPQWILHVQIIQSDNILGQWMPNNWNFQDHKTEIAFTFLLLCFYSCSPICTWWSQMNTIRKMPLTLFNSSHNKQCEGGEKAD